MVKLQLIGLDSTGPCRRHLIRINTTAYLALSLSMIIKRNQVQVQSVKSDSIQFMHKAAAIQQRTFSHEEIIARKIILFSDMRQRQHTF